MDKLKEKIFGLIVVIALGVIFIPMLFNSSHKQHARLAKDLPRAPESKVDAKTLQEPQAISSLKGDKEQAQPKNEAITGQATEKEVEVAVNAAELSPSVEAKQKEETEREKLAQENAEKERLKQEKAEKEKLAQEKAEKEKLAQEKLAQEKAEKERLAQEKAAEKEKLAQEKAEKEKLAQEKLAQEKADKDRLAQEKLVQEKAEQEKLAQEKATEKERLSQEKAEEKERVATEKARRTQEKLAQPESEQGIKEQERTSPEKSASKTTKAAKERKKAKASRSVPGKVFSAQGAWLVQLGTFAYPEHATTLVRKLKTAGYPAFTRQLYQEDRVLTVVYVGPVVRKDDASKLIAAFQGKYNVKGIVIRYEPE